MHAFDGVGRHRARGGDDFRACVAQDLHDSGADTLRAAGDEHAVVG
jgi:hypothetical protein